MTTTATPEQEQRAETMLATMTLEEKVGQLSQYFYFTAFPAQNALAERVQATAAREARAVGIHWAFALMVDIARDPRWGRIVEGAGEDPYLGAQMAAAQVRGFQGTAKPAAQSAAWAGMERRAVIL